MGKDANYYIQTPRDRRYVTAAAWALLKDTKGYSLIEVVGQSSGTLTEPEPAKKNEVAARVEEKEDHKVITFDEPDPDKEEESEFASIDEDIYDITALRDEYEKITGKSPDKRWKEGTLRTKIEEAK